MGKYLGLDYGDRRLGVALSDPQGQIAFPRPPLKVSTLEQLLEELALFCKEEGVLKIILGWPLHTNGQEGERARATRHFADQLQKTLPQVPLEFFDERFTTQWAVDKLREGGVKAKEQKGERDSLAAQILLQTYLDARGR